MVQGLFAPTLESAGVVNEDFIAICEKGVYAYYNIREDKQFGQYQMAGTFIDGNAAVRMNGKWGIVDTKGDTVVEPSYDDILLDSQGRYINQSVILAKRDGKYHLLDSKWNPVNDFSCDNADMVTEDGIFAYSVNGKWGFADTKGNVIIEPTYEGAKSFSNGLAAVCIKGVWGFINRDRTIVIPCQFLDADYFNIDGGCMIRTTEESWKLLLLNIK